MIEVVKDILKIEKIEYKNLTKSESGFSNLVYFVDDKLVIKVLDSNGNEIKFANEIGFYNSVEFDFIPNCISTGEYKNTKYIILEKLQGFLCMKYGMNFLKKNAKMSLCILLIY